MRHLIARNETARFTSSSSLKSYIFFINQSFWTGSLCYSIRKYTKIADSSKKSADSGADKRPLPSNAPPKQAATLKQKRNMINRQKNLGLEVQT